MPGKTTFIYFPQSRKIIYSKTKKRIKTTHVYTMFLEKKPFEILEAYTLRDVKDEVMNKFAKMKKNPLGKMNSQVYGPALPLNQTKLYQCQDCSVATPNRFKCTGCWEQYSELDDADHIYVI